MADVTLSDISKSYGNNVALDSISIKVNDAEFVSLLGPSGCGKTTALRIIAGLLRPGRGRLFFGRSDVTDLPADRRNVGVVFQDYALFPHLTIVQNIAFGPRQRKVPRQKAMQRAAELLDLVQMSELGERFPHEISGGQRQRVAFARAVAYPPKALLMDEPLAALDLRLRETMQQELRRLQRSLGITTIFVTHDQGEAMHLSDRIAVMNAGRIEQVGTSPEIYDSPASRFVAEFVGRINLLPVEARGRDGAYVAVSSNGQTLHARDTAWTSAGRALLAVRPHDLAVARKPGETAGHNSLTGRLVEKSFAGNHFQLVVVVDDQPIHVEVRPGADLPQLGDQMTLHWHPQHSYLLDA